MLYTGTKNPKKHRIWNEEAEEIFFRDPWVAEASRLEDREIRWAALGRSERGRVAPAITISVCLPCFLRGFAISVERSGLAVIMREDYGIFLPSGKIIFTHERS
jgi:hypothetical protein